MSRPIGLGFGEGDVGILQKLAVGGSITGRHRDTDTGADPDAMPFDIERKPEHVDKTPGKQRCVVGALQADLHDREFIAAEPRDRVDLAYAGRQPHGDGAQQGIADDVAQRIVGVLEVIEIEAKQSEDVAAPGLADGLLDAFGEKRPVRESGQAVVPSEEHDLGFAVQALGHILVGLDPATLAQRLMRDRDKAVVGQIDDVCSRHPPCDAPFDVEQAVVAPTEVVPSRHAQSQDSVQGHAGRDRGRGKPEDLAKAPIEDLQAIVRPIKTQTLGHVGEGDIEPLVRFDQSRLLLLQHRHVAEDEKRAALPRCILADAKPTAVLQADLAGRRGPYCAQAQADPALQESQKIGRRAAGTRFYGQIAHEIRGLRIRRDDLGRGIDNDDAFARAIERIGQKRLRGAALGNLALEAFADVAAHHFHGRKEGAEFVSAARGNRYIKLSASDPHRDVGRFGDGSEDGARKEPSDQARDKDGGQGQDDVDAHVEGDSRLCTFAVGEAITCRIINEEFELLLDDQGLLIQRLPIFTRARTDRRGFLQSLPGSHRFLDAGTRLRGPFGLRPFDRDRKIVGKLFPETDEFLVERRAHLGVRGQEPTRGYRLHGIEIRRGGTGIIDRHKRLVKRLGDELALASQSDDGGHA